MSTLDIYGSLEFVNPILFDLDYTLVKTKSEYKFPRYAADFEFLPGMINMLRELDRPIVIITNQGGRNKVLINNRIKKIFIELQKICNVTIFVAHAYNKYRKPDTGIWDEYIKSRMTMQPIYVGDALGREGDFSDSDLVFAKNIGAKIYSPEEFLENYK